MAVKLYVGRYYYLKLLRAEKLRVNTLHIKPTRFPFGPFHGVEAGTGKHQTLALLIGDLLVDM